MNIEERIAKIRAAHEVHAPTATQTANQFAPAEKKAFVVKVKREVAPEEAPSSEKVFDIANNTVAKIMDRSDLSDEGKLQAVVAFLTAEDTDYGAAQKCFAEFEAYFTYEQSKRTQVSEQHIQRLMSELQDGTKAAIENIIRDFNVVNDGAGNIKKLLRVMEKARVDGTTIETLTNAYKVNESLLKEIDKLNGSLASERREEAQAQNRLQYYQKESGDGFLSRLWHAFDDDEGASDSTYFSHYKLDSIRTKIQENQDAINERQRQRNRKLEDGELTILRTVDATEGGFTDQIVKTAKDSLALIMGTRASIEQLLVANAKSRAAANEIAIGLNSATGRETILKGALQMVAKATRLQGETLNTQVATLTQDKAEAAGDEAQFTLATLDLDKMNQTARVGVRTGPRGQGRFLRNARLRGCASRSPLAAIRQPRRIPS